MATGADLDQRIAYRQRFKNGATVFPRRFFVVEPEPVSRLGARRDAPRVRGRTGTLDKKPWTSVEPPRGPIEAQFLRPLILGETILPYRLLEPATAVIPLHDTRILDANAAAAQGFRYLAAWLNDIEAKWAANSRRDTAGDPRMSLSERINHMRNLTNQANETPFRIALTASGTRLSASRLEPDRSIVEHKAYWAPARTPAEAHYLLSIINSDGVLSRITDLQSHGQRDKRDFDNLVWTLPIPEYDATDTLHRDLAAAAARAEQVAASVDLGPHNHFTAKRRAIRAALAADGIAAEIEALVAALLPT